MPPKNEKISFFSSDKMSAENLVNCVYICLIILVACLWGIPQPVLPEDGDSKSYDICYKSNGELCDALGEDLCAQYWDCANCLSSPCGAWSRDSNTCNNIFQCVWSYHGCRPNNIPVQNNINITDCTKFAGSNSSYQNSYIAFYSVFIVINLVCLTIWIYAYTIQKSTQDRLLQNQEKCSCGHEWHHKQKCFQKITVSNKKCNCGHHHSEICQETISYTYTPTQRILKKVSVTKYRTETSSVPTTRLVPVVTKYSEPVQEYDYVKQRYYTKYSQTKYNTNYERVTEYKNVSTSVPYEVQEEKWVDEPCGPSETRYKYCECKKCTCSICDKSGISCYCTKPCQCDNCAKMRGNKKSTQICCCTLAVYGGLCIIFGLVLAVGTYNWHPIRQNFGYTYLASYNVGMFVIMIGILTLWASNFVLVQI